MYSTLTAIIRISDDVMNMITEDLPVVYLQELTQQVLRVLLNALKLALYLLTFLFSHNPLRKF